MDDGKDDIPLGWGLPNRMDASGVRTVLFVARPMATRRMITSGLMHCNGPVSLQSSVVESRRHDAP